MPPRNDTPLTPTAADPGIFEGTDGDDVIRYGDTDGDGDQVTDGGNVINAGAGNDTVYAGYGDDTIDGGTGSDWLFGSQGDDMLSGGADNDTLWGDEGNDSLYGNEGDDKLIGGAGDDLLTGGEGNDLLIGDNNPGDQGGLSPEDPAEPGFGNDTLVTSTGNDTAYGGSGDDVFRVFDEFGHHHIVGGETGETEGDTLDASAVTADLTMYYTSDEKGTFTDYGATVNFSEIEKMYLGTGDDRVEVIDTTTGYVHGGDSFDTLILPEGDDAPEVVITSEVPYPAVPGATSKTGYVMFKDGSRLDFESFEKIENKCICFTPGTLIDTLRGRVAVEGLVAGDKVLTRDHGYQELTWTGRRDLTMADLAGSPEVGPVRIAAGALGRGLPERDLTVSPRHRMLVTGARAELMFGEREVLVAAQDLLGLPGVSRADLAPVSYIHVMCERHEIIRAEGAWTESFQPAEAVVDALEEATRAELLALFPALATEAGRAGFAAARPVLSGAEAKTLFAA
ncbi:MAG: Hint domain-containing protein [Proteobacteria bacterium]|nr:Hint domain-containing protein [Pseudomonadota bacterium]